MKKEKRKIQILRQMTEGDIKALGGERWTRRKLKGFVVLAIACFAWMVGFTTLFAGGVVQIISVIPFMVSFVIWMVFYFREGNKLWNYVKDKEQPVDLG